MKNSSKFTSVVIVLALCAFTIYKCQVSPPPAPSSEENSESVNEPTQESMAEPLPDTAAAPFNNANAAQAPNAIPAAAVDDATVQTNFSKALMDLGQCFNIQGPTAERTEPSLQNFNDFVKPHMGEMVSSSENWINTDIELPNGEKRRIRIEMEFSDENKPQKKLRYFSLDANGNMSPMNLSREQSENASDALIATLESDGKIINREKGITAYYPGWVEVELVERNGRIADIQALMGESGRFTCANMHTNQGACKCHN